MHRVSLLLNNAKRNKDGVPSPSPASLPNTPPSFHNSPASRLIAPTAFDDTSTRSQQADSDIQMQWFFSQFEALCSTLLDPTLSQREAVAQREQKFALVFRELTSCEPSTQLEVVDLLASLIERRPKLISGVESILSLVVQLIESIEKRTKVGAISIEMATTLQTKLFWLVGLIGRKHLTVRDMKSLFSILERAVEGKLSSFLCPLVLTSLSDMHVGASASFADGPMAFFEFNGTDSALVIPKGLESQG